MAEGRKKAIEIPVVSALEMRCADAATSEKIGIPSLVLMERAALAMREEIQKRFPPCRVAIVCGRGNNGADGLALARLLSDAGYDVHPLVIPGAEKEGSSAFLQEKILSALNIPVEAYEKGAAAALAPAVAVDALFGTGLSRAPEGTYAAAVEDLNQAREQGSFVLACDLPSGISSDTGEVLGCAVQADLTVTFGFAKRGTVLYPGCLFCGKTLVRDIGIPESALEKRPLLYTIRESALPDLLPIRSPAGNKGTFGKVLLPAGSRGMAGACLLAAEAAGRAGAGMVKVFTQEENRLIVQTKRPECLLATWEEGRGEEAKETLRASMAWADTIAAGSGMGTGPLQSALLTEILSYAKTAPLRRDGTKKAFLFDADALRMIAEENLYEDLKRAGERAPILLTPHMGEAALLLGTSIPDLKAHALEAGAAFSKKERVSLLLKDARSFVFAPDDEAVYVNTTGNDALATAGSGDCLAGICAALLAQGLSPAAAGRTGALVHGLAAEALAADLGRRGVLASDLPGAAAKVLAAAALADFASAGDREVKRPGRGRALPNPD